MDNLETSLATAVDKACGNTSGSIMERFIKPISSIIFGHKVYSLDCPGPQTAISRPHEDFFRILSGYGYVEKYHSVCTKYGGPLK